MLVPLSRTTTKIRYQDKVLLAGVDVCDRGTSISPHSAESNNSGSDKVGAGTPSSVVCLGTALIFEVRPIKGKG